MATPRLGSAVRVLENGSELGTMNFGNLCSVKLQATVLQNRFGAHRLDLTSAVCLPAFQVQKSKPYTLSPKNPKP